MKRFFLLLSFLCPLLLAQSFDIAILEAMKRNSKIKALEQEIEKLENDSLVASKWENPTLSIGYNTLYLTNPSYRDDAMQSISISLSQKIDIAGKKNLESQKISLKKQIKILELKALKKNIIKELKIRAIRSYQDQKRIEILKSILDNILLFKNQINASSSDFPLDGIYKMEILETKIKLRINQYRENQKTQMIEFNEITFQGDQELGTQPTFEKNWNGEYYKRSYEFLIQKYKEDIENENISLAKRSFLSDPTLSVGYFHRKKQQDFISLGVSFSLPIYGKEYFMLQSAYKQSQIVQNATLETQNRIQAKIKKLLNTLEQKQIELSLIENNLLPNTKKLLLLYQNNISTSKSAMGAYHQALNDLLDAELLRIEVSGSVLIAMAELESIGE